MFWDSSAFVPLLLEEPSTRELTAAFDADEKPAIWWASAVEAKAAVARAHRDRRILQAEIVPALDRLRIVTLRAREVTPSEEVRGRALRLLNVHVLRAGDALQLAAAVIWCEEQTAGETFVCLDKRLRDAARREGFVLLPVDDGQALRAK